MSGHQRRMRTVPVDGSGGAGASGGVGGFGSPARSSGFGSPATISRSQSMVPPSPGRRLHGAFSSSLSAAEEASMTAAQELASVMNAPPPAAGAGSWLAAWPFNQAFGQEDFDAPPPPLPPGTLPEVQLSDFNRYLRSVGDRLDTLARSKEASQQRLQNALSPEDLRASQGQGLVAAMREVPAPFFQEGFTLDQRQLWEELVQVESEDGRQESLERLSGYLDAVEAHLVRECAARTDNFFDASGYIQDVRGSVTRLFQQVAGLRQQMHTLEQETGAAVATSQQLQRQRGNLIATLDMLRAMEAAAQAQSALQGLLPRAGGVSVDYAGAIDVLEVLQGVLDDETLLSLDCFQHLPGQIVETAQAVDDLMTSDFLERTRFSAAAAITGGILDRLRAQLAASIKSGSNTPHRRRSSQQSGGTASLAPSRQLSADESAELAGLAALRLEDTKAVDRVVGWLERCYCPGGGVSAAAAMAAAMAGGSGEDGGDGRLGDGETLQEVLLPLVMGLQRMGRLPATMKDLRDTSAARLKALLSNVIEGCLDVLDPESAPGDTSHLLSHRSPSPGRRDGDGATSALGARLARLPGQEFQWLLEAVVLASQAYINHCTAVGDAIQTILAAAKASTQQLAAAAQESRECCQGVAETAAGRWSKLLSGRARSSAEAGGSGVIRLAELQGVLELTDLLASLVEQYGVRGVLGLRSALQQLCKAALDGLHSRSLSKLTTLLEQEQWTAVQVPPEFQRIAQQLEEQGAAAGQLPGSSPTAGSTPSAPNGHAAAAAEANGIGGGRQRVGSLTSEEDGGSGAAAEAGEDGGGGQGAPRKFTITPHDSSPPDPAAQQAQHADGASGGTVATAGPSPVLWVGGKRYHVVNTQLLLLSTLREYLAFRDAVPAFGAEVAQRVLELLKVFNSRTCQLVLGAGAMQVSGLKSITAKHLALSCQCLGAFMALQPALVAAFTAGLMPPRRDMLVADFGRALKDYRIHHEEVCTKLVAIMRERLSANIKQLPALAAGWPSGGERPELPAPSGFATTTAKQLNILSGALSPLLLPEELHSIFGRIGLMFSRTLAEAYEMLEPHGAAWEQQLRADTQFLLNCLRNLPMDPADRDSNLECLTSLFEQRFMLAAQQAPAPHPPRQQRPSPPAADTAAAQPVVAPAQQAAPAQVAEGAEVAQPQPEVVAGKQAGQLQAAQQAGQEAELFTEQHLAAAAAAAAAAASPPAELLAAGLEVPVMTSEQAVSSSTAVGGEEQGNGVVPVDGTPASSFVPGALAHAEGQQTERQQEQQGSPQQQQQQQQQGPEAQARHPVQQGGSPPAALAAAPAVEQQQQMAHPLDDQPRVLLSGQQQQQQPEQQQPEQQQGQQQGRPEQQQQEPVPGSGGGQAEPP